ncbi:NADPH-dependent 3-demethoxyubiquinone 3-hydroxylase, mitochondrial isoform 2-T2 [Callospermophilus lateralis]|uniref:NADPH-dependent 3-demethoxyubiquinone 3-hydroxylase, mitochondrial isoform X2 n=1 Tax=Callospermophilus lateralis TaxID=76772 RepID=UPI004038A9D8
MQVNMERTESMRARWPSWAGQASGRSFREVLPPSRERTLVPGGKVWSTDTAGRRRPTVCGWYSDLMKMWDQEKDHLKKFNELMVAFRVRPTVLMPFWNVVGFALGAGTALLGKEGAMACTVAVEESIAHHYNNQIRTLMEEDPEKYQELLQVIKKFRDEELEHHDLGLDHDAELAPAYAVLKSVIQAGCSAAIYLSERL